MRRRSKAREYALQMLYQWEMAKYPVEKVTELFWPCLEETEREIVDFANKLLENTARHKDELDSIISCFATNWRIDRIAKVELNILRIAVYEFLYEPDIPAKVSINEAVELAKKFGDIEASKFINGVLDKIRKEKIASKV